ncbi:hypothetical protein [Ferruginibacter sp.]
MIKSKVHHFSGISYKIKKRKAETSAFLEVFSNQDVGGGGGGGVGGLGGVLPVSPLPSELAVTTCINLQFVFPGIWLGLWHSIAHTR